MQGAFEESLVQAHIVHDEAAQREKSIHNGDPLDPSIRKYLAAEAKNGRDERARRRLRQKRDEQYHPLWKLTAQIVFGVHLLHTGTAVNDEDVATILQQHVNEVDEFLEDTTEDFDLAQSDIEERIRNLRIPLENVGAFDEMLENREFRLQIAEGNERVEYVVNRTTNAMNRALVDVQEGLKATDELARYLLRVNHGWDSKSEEIIHVYSVLTGNTEGWYRTFIGLQMKGSTLGLALAKLTGLVAELQRRTGIASRKNKVRILQILSFKLY
jgi:hypothetical protein